MSRDTTDLRYQSTHYSSKIVHYEWTCTCTPWGIWWSNYLSFAQLHQLPVSSSTEQSCMIWKVDLQKTHFSFPYLFNIPRDYYLPEDSALFLMTDLRALAISYLQLQLKPRQSKSNKALEQGINLQMLTNSQEQHCCARNRHKRFRRECIWCQVEGLFDDGVKKVNYGTLKERTRKKRLACYKPFLKATCNERCAFLMDSIWDKKS